MIMAGMEYRGEIPFKNVYLTGIVRDKLGRKMSKSLGNSPDPLDLIAKYGADGVRTGMLFSSPAGNDLPFDEGLCEQGRNFSNKIWNAFRFIMMNLPEGYAPLRKEELRLELADRWIYSRLNETARDAAEHYSNLRLNDAGQSVFQFIWDEFCSWYIELSKDRLQSDDPAIRGTALYILLDVMQTSMRLLHPIMPFITEEIWQSIRSIFPQPEEALIVAAFPACDTGAIDPEIADDMAFMQEAISAVRNLRKQLNLNPGARVNLAIRVAEDRQKELFARYAAYFAKLAKVDDLDVARDLAKPPASIAAVVRNVEIFLPLKGLVDFDAERARLAKQIEKLEKELAGINAKLNNQNFLNNAKAEVVENERQRLAETGTKLSLTKDLLADLE